MYMWDRRVTSRELRIQELQHVGRVVGDGIRCKGYNVYGWLGWWEVVEAEDGAWDLGACRNASSSALFRLIYSFVAL
jgi:hypothetical protein